MIKPELIKVCGLSTPQTLDAVIEGGATHAGFIFFEKSPRNLDLSKAAELADHAGGRILKVAVTVNADDKKLERIIKKTNPDLLQLHGQETPERVLEIKQHHGVNVIKACAIAKPGHMLAAKTYANVADMMLFDAKAPAGSQLPGGNGVAFEWDIVDLWPKHVPYMLSGGLDINNIVAALQHTDAKAIDISSGVETSPGHKDTRLIRDFLAAVT